MLSRHTFASAGVRDGDLISLLRARPPASGPAQPAQGPPMRPRNADGSLVDPQAFIRSLLANPGALASIPPALADVVRRGDVAALNGFFRHAEGPTYSQLSQL